LHLTVLGTAISPKHTIIGAPDASNLYSSANGSITGGSHNPFLAGPVSFSLTVAGVTASTVITNAIFSFNTTAGTEVPGIPGIPEPLTLSLTGAGLLSLALARRYRAKRK
jgi:hypothetical protein